LTAAGKAGKIPGKTAKDDGLEGIWKFEILRQEARSRRLILEGHIIPPYPRPYHDPLFFYLVLGPDYLSLEVSRDFDGDNFLTDLARLWGPPEEGPRIQVGGRQDEEEGALQLVEYHFLPDLRPEMLRRLGEILDHPLPGAAAVSPAATEES
jgi:hypothetical protein